MGQFFWWVFVKFLFPALIGYLSNPVIARVMNNDGLQSFASSAGGGNSLLVGIVIGVVVCFILTGDNKWVAEIRAKWQAWCSGLLINAGTKIKPEGV